MIMSVPRPRAYDNYDEQQESDNIAAGSLNVDFSVVRDTSYLKPDARRGGQY